MRPRPHDSAQCERQTETDRGGGGTERDWCVAKRIEEGLLGPSSSISSAPLSALPHKKNWSFLWERNLLCGQQREKGREAEAWIICATSMEVKWWRLHLPSSFRFRRGRSGAGWTRVIPWGSGSMIFFFFYFCPFFIGVIVREGSN